MMDWITTTFTECNDDGYGANVNCPCGESVYVPGDGEGECDTCHRTYSATIHYSLSVYGAGFDFIDEVKS